MNDKIMKALKLIIITLLILCVLVVVTNKKGNQVEKESGLTVSAYTDYFRLPAYSQQKEVILEHSVYYINVGETVQIKVLSENEDLLTWFSSNRDIATVDEYGSVTGISEGRINIFAEISYKEYAYAEIVVVDNNKTTIEEVQKQDAKKTKKKANGRNTDFKNVIPPSHKQNKDNNQPGETNEQPTKQTEQPVENNEQPKENTEKPKDQSEQPKQPVNKNIAVTSVTLSTKSIKVGTGSSDPATIKATISPSNATNKKITWTSSNEHIATVVNGIIKGKHSGTATITATSSNGKKATATVTVTSTERIHFLPLKSDKEDTVQKGDAILLESNGYYAMIDTGQSKGPSKKNIANYFKKFADNNGIMQLEFILITHNHTDHTYGLLYLLRNNLKEEMGVGINVKEIYLKRHSSSLTPTKEWEIYKKVMGCVRGTSDNCKAVPNIKFTQDIDNPKCADSHKAHGDINCTANIQFENMTIKLYNTGFVMKDGDLGATGTPGILYSNTKKETYNANYESIYEYIKVNNHKIVLAADALGEPLFQTDGWYKTIMKDTGTGIDLLKAPHHGDTNSDKNFASLKPKAVAITNSEFILGKNNSTTTAYPNSRIYYVEYYKPTSEIKTLYADFSTSEVKYSRIPIYK